MSQPPQAVRSDLRTILGNLDILLRQMRSSINDVSGQLLAMAAAVECITLTMKLRTTLKRWQVYLPFHECKDVDFKHWVKYLTNIHLSLDNRQKRQDGSPDYEYYPDHPFSLDMLEMLDFEAGLPADYTDSVEAGGGLPLFAPRYADSELQRDVQEYVQRVDERMENLTILSEDEEQEWHTVINKRAMSFLRNLYAGHLRMLFRQMQPRMVEEKMLPKVKAYLDAVIDQPAMAYCLDMALDTLLDTLRQIDGLFSISGSRQQYLRLSLRLYYRHCPNTEAETSSEVRRWASEWPGRRRRQRAVEKHDQIVAGLRQQYGELRIEDYIDIEHPSPLADAEFGQFLFACRHQLEIDSVKSLFRDCFLILHLNRLIDPAGMEANISAMQLDQYRRQIYQRLTELVRKAEWQGGMTAERVQHSLADLLLKSVSSTMESEFNVGETFWKLLTNRRGCKEEFRSLKLTWLNLVGYFRTRGFLRGGSPALCHHFFPGDRTNDIDHNAVNKGAGDRAGNDFHDLRLALDRRLENTPQFHSSQTMNSLE